MNRPRCGDRAPHHFPGADGTFGSPGTRVVLVDGRPLVRATQRRILHAIGRGAHVELGVWNATVPLHKARSGEAGPPLVAVELTSEMVTGDVVKVISGCRSGRFGPLGDLAADGARSDLDVLLRLRRLEDLNPVLGIAEYARLGLGDLTTVRRLAAAGVTADDVMDFCVELGNVDPVTAVDQIESLARAGVRPGDLSAFAAASFDDVPTVERLISAGVTADYVTVLASFDFFFDADRLLDYHRTGVDAIVAGLLISAGVDDPDDVAAAAATGVSNVELAAYRDFYMSTGQRVTLADIAHIAATADGEDRPGHFDVATIAEYASAPLIATADALAAGKGLLWSSWTLMDAGAPLSLSVLDDLAAAEMSAGNVAGYVAAGVTTVVDMVALRDDNIPGPLAADLASTSVPSRPDWRADIATYRAAALNLADTVALRALGHHDPAVIRTLLDAGVTPAVAGVLVQADVDASDAASLARLGELGLTADVARDLAVGVSHIDDIVTALEAGYDEETASIFASLLRDIPVER